MQSQCFKAYDIRGKVPGELNEALAERIGYALSLQLGGGLVVVGHDVRLTSPVLADAVSHGLAAGGRGIIDIGLCGTEEVYYQTDARNAAGGVMVTASHNPMDYNGMKLVRKGARPISGDSGLHALRDWSIGNEPMRSPAASPEKLVDPDRSGYVHHLLGYVDAEKWRPLKVIVNAGNGGAGLVVDALAQHLPMEFVRIQHDPDGTFPNGIPNPLLPASRSATSDAVRAHGADMGIAWDGDFDRCFFFDGDGRFIEGYYLVGLLARSMLERAPGSKVIHDPRLVWNTQEIVREAGGVPIMSKTGHAFIKERMRQENAIYGGEMSAHHYFRDFAYCDSGMIPWLLVAGLISDSGLTLGELVDERMRRFPCSGEINFKVAEPQAAIHAIAAKYAAHNPVMDHTDGFSADFGAWRYNLRMSNTEPLLRLNVETRADPSLLEDRVGEITDLLERFG
ncbi:phosphomannomutase [Lysobacter oculi]|uniref:phosphomannomutase n=1 Tax=Solilutibacter oculi TaxID=2698682 RepID=A0A344J6P8_9GAMM|nr:phosphomannomutase [Lysobacter oculi]AXA84708.1 phosphomannomutase [Lysobacter oculi]